MFPNPNDAFPLPPRPSLDQYKKLAKDLLKASNSSDPTALRTWAADWMSALSRLSAAGSNNSSVIPSEVAASRSEAATQSRDLLSHLGHGTAQLEDFARQQLAEKSTLSAAQFVIARAHGFESWPKLAKHIEATAHADSAVNHFEQAADAIVTGDFPTLAHLLKKYPGLARARSTRRHNATLLHYLSANGFEDYRQKTPQNIVPIAKLLLDAGAAVNAIAVLYGGSTTLSLTATSIHPERAGVQASLMQLLLDHGATLDSENSPSGGIVNICLANGRARAAEFLADHGAPLDLEGAAGLGRLDIVKTFFDESGSPTSTSTNIQKERGFLWACEYGCNPVVDFLLDHGIPIQTQANTGQTALHWAVIGGHEDTITLLLAHGAQLEARNIYGGTVLGQALWSSVHGDSSIDYARIIDLLKRQGATPQEFEEKEREKEKEQRTRGAREEEKSGEEK